MLSGKYGLFRKKYDDDGGMDIHIDQSESIDHSFQKVMIEGNTRMTIQARKINDTYSQNPLEVRDFNIVDSQSLFDPFIWNIICLITSNLEEVSSYKRNPVCLTQEFISFPNESTPFGMQRKIKRIVSVFVLQFILSDTCTYPFHIVIANVIKRLSHSSALLQMMNRLGFSCSECTLDRFLQLVKDVRDANGPLASLDENVLTHVTIDNMMF